MKIYNKHLWLMLVILLIVCPGRLEAQQAVTMRFFDSATGYAIQPELVVTQNAVTGALNEHHPTQQVGSSGSLPLSLYTGMYDATVKASGYHSLSTYLEIQQTSAVGDVTSPEVMTLYLDPLQLPEEIQAESVHALHSDAAMALLGFIVDEQYGTPLEGVSVGSIEHNITTNTDKRGFFLLYIPVDPEKLSEDPEQTPQDFATIRFEKSGYIVEERQNVEIWPQGDVIYQIRLRQGTGEETFDEKAYREAERLFFDEDLMLESTGKAAVSGQSIPATIKVGRSCRSRTNCRYVEVYSLQQYCKHSLASEWIPSWGANTGGMNSLRAGSVAIRSYAASFVYAPINSRYDICDSTACQRFDPTRQYSWTNNAVDETLGTVLRYPGSGNIARSEYSAENNNSGCGDGYSGTGSTWPCIPDPVCKGKTKNGHGRGMCQWGSYRWSIGAGGYKDWQWILTHYYPNYTISGSNGTCCDCSGNNPVLNCTIRSGETCSCQAATITLKPGFHAQYGSTVTLRGQ